MKVINLPTLYECEVCGSTYVLKELAEACENNNGCPEEIPVSVLSPGDEVLRMERYGDIIKATVKKVEVSIRDGLLPDLFCINERRIWNIFAIDIVETTAERLSRHILKDEKYLLKNQTLKSPSHLYWVKVTLDKSYEIGKGEYTSISNEKYLLKLNDLKWTPFIHVDYNSIIITINVVPPKNTSLLVKDSKENYYVTTFIGLENNIWSNFNLKNISITSWTQIENTDFLKYD